MTTWEASVIEKVKQDSKGKTFDPIPKTNFSVHITFPNGTFGVFMKIKYPLDIGCTLYRHQILGVNAVVNARGGRQQLNDLTQEDIELRRDAQKIRDWQSSHICFYQFNSRFFRRHQKRVQHLLSSYEDL
jgi:hypothetical protein